MDIALRAAAIFVLLWFVLRVTGKREISQLSAFEFILLIALGDLVAQGVLGEDTSITGAAVAVSTFGLLSVGLSWVSWRFERTRPFLDGRPSVVIRDGQVLDDVLAAERVPMDDLHEAAREKSIRSLADVELALLEPDGTFSFFERQDPDGGQGDPPDTASDTTGQQNT